MTVFGAVPTMREVGIVLSVAAALVAVGYSAGVWHVSTFVATEAFKRLEQRVERIEQAHK